jgi:hypothetical protein
MLFSPIPPTTMLHQVLSERKTWFALAHEHDDCYLPELRSDDVTLILDNGAYERQPLSGETYVRTIQLYQPTVAVLPDMYCGPWKRSMSFSLGFLEQWSRYRWKEGLDPQWMYVPQAEPGDLQGWTESLLWGCNDERVSWIGLPRCLVTHITKNSLARVFWADYIKEKFPHVKVHALGMVNGNVHELAFLAERGVRSVDSSCPFNAENINHWEDKLKEIDSCLKLYTV